MTQGAYIIYLETLAISLLNERDQTPYAHIDIPSTDTEAPVFARDFTFTSHNARACIADQRKERGV